MADTLARAISEAAPGTTVVSRCLSKYDKNDALTDVFRSKAILVGSPTVNKGILTSVAAVLEEAKGLRFRNKKAAAFGSYGWSGESVAQLGEHLKAAGFTVLNDGIKALWAPDQASQSALTAFAKDFVAAL